ncbi:3-phosphoshikimate 1-carboxyvinyltransferase, partial [Globisporangium splendens]
MAQQQQVIPCGSYDIVLGSSLLSSRYVAEDILALMPSTSTFVILTDTNVAPLYAQPLFEQLTHLLAGQATKRVLIHAVPAGEESKCREMKAKIEDEVFFPNRCHRDTCVIAVGGGVVGDLSGYVAATYMRGVPFIQIPTTLLACVDSSIGGKTGIDVEDFGKNLLGAFHMPQRVYVDLSTLQTLPKRELINGMGEVIKAGAIFDAALFDLLEASTDQILALSDMKLVQQVVAMAVAVKAHVVTLDTKEMGLRAILNFGHSVGHGIEALLQPEYLHGECVSIGMIKEAEIARGMGVCTSATVGRLRRCLTAYGLPVRVPENVPTKDVVVKMEVDKKNSQGVKKIVLLERIGEVLSNPYARAIKDSQIELVLEKQVRMVPGHAANGKIRVPGSKSISNRALLMAALGKGSCRISGLLHSDDTQVMMNALLKVGAKFSWEDNGAVLVVEGTGGKFDAVADGEEIYLSNAGTAARFLTSTMTLLDNPDRSVVVTGNHRMKERPIAPLVDALRSNGCDLKYLEADGCPPIAVRGTGMKGGVMRLASKVSSQYVSSVLINAPYAKEPLVLELEEEHPTSLPYILMTTQLMKEFGIEVETLAPNKYRVPCGVYMNPAEFSIEVDASSATYPLAFAAITGGEVTVEALGNTSLQGDAAFHTLLRAMGCTTTQDAFSTTVVGPPAGTPLQAVEIDMETMTDAFMTAVALAAVAKGTTKITGIANQRVKECNRIEVMVTELRKIGVECGELPDGIWVTGTAGKTDQLKKAYIACHNDHRIAMSFAVLGAVVNDVIVTDKECTDKTYPEFWDHVQMHLGLQVAPVIGAEHDQQKEEDKSSSKTPGFFLIGMRGAGKTSLAKAAASALGLNLLDTDEELEREFGESIASFVAKHDNTWDEFRVRQRALLLRLIANPPASTIISCGGGVVETPEIVDALAKYPYVIHVHRAIEDVLAYLDSETNRPSLGESHDSVWMRRAPLYQKSSSFEFNVNHGDADFERINRDFVRFVNVVIPNLSTSFDHTSVCRLDTFFLSLTFPDVNDARALIKDITEGVDALELRVDLLKSYSDINFVASQVTLLRSLSPLPIIFTVRSRAQGGAFPDDDEATMFQLLHLAVRLGCEFVDVETCWSRKARDELLASRHRSAVISSFHAIQEPTSEAQAKAIFRECYHQGKVQVVKVVLKAFEPQDALMVDRVAKDFVKVWQHEMPIISLCTMDAGKMARVLNRVLTPVTHPLLPAAAAPGQLSVVEILTLRKQLGLLPGREFFLFGSPIQKSPSPSMHNAAFQAHGLPLFTYGLHDTTEILEVVARMQAPNTTLGGGSVTIPLKVDVMPYLDELTPAARAIGAVNTVIRDDRMDGTVRWKGDNTDWLGILRPITKRLAVASNSSRKDLVALVVGAGGTSMAASYAMRQLGVGKLFIYNRTLAKAEEVAQRFNAQALSSLTPETLAHVDIVVSTIPAQAGFVLPDHLVQGSVIVLDAAYQPPITPFLAHAHANGASCIQGYEMLYEQAIEQYNRWHKLTQVGRDAIDIEDIMKQACLERIPSDQRLA